MIELIRCQACGEKVDELFPSIKVHPQTCAQFLYWRCMSCFQLEIDNMLDQCEEKEMWR